ncbi:MAG: DASH subunit Spc19 [Lasallia pustulata]|uniref:DASH complex subunit SPC19 n=1 Tax=Lasallia pustulata TaxID=136370 RepID=A0A5M8PGZ6_9LECA|nr:MAG: DASH subunit Spc19 [Lasallia pustulata]
MPTSSPLASCVSSLQSSMQLLGSSISILDSGVNDFPRLSKVLHTTRHFELLPETRLLQAQKELLETITPEVETLLARVDAHLDRMERREKSLIAKCELQEGRLSSNRQSGGNGLGNPSSSYSRTRGGGGRDGGMRGARAGFGDEEGEGEKGREALRLKQMRTKKERLSYAVERLALQAQQRERQLRMSVAAG